MKEPKAVNISKGDKPLCDTCSVVGCDYNYYTGTEPTCDDDVDWTCADYVKQEGVKQG